MSHLWLLHGFLGKQSDWADIGLEALGFDGLHALDLYSDQRPFGSWATHTNTAVATRSERDNVLVGYSMGGRLALHLLAERPELWSRAIIVSSHPGLRSDAERVARRQADDVWARRFESEDWAALMQAWNAQSVFSTDSDNARIEGDYRRTALAHCLREWSLGRQRDFRPLIESSAPITTWITGAEDRKFADLARDLRQDIPALECITIADAGHRLIGCIDWPGLIAG